MRIVYIGSGPVACPAFRALHESERHRTVRVVSQPDRPSGRKRRPAPCPLKALAESLGYEVCTPESIRAPEAVQPLADVEPEAIVVADYAQFLPRSVLDLPPYGTLNIHPSLLPKYRGAAPVQWALINGDTETGVSIAYVTPAMDAGDIVLQRTCAIAPDDNAETLSQKLAGIGAELLLNALDGIEDGTASAIPQDDAAATFAPKLKKEDGRIDFNLSASALLHRIRGLYPWPGSFIERPAWGADRVKVLRAEYAEGAGMPGEVLRCDPEGPVLACGKDAVQLTEVQPAGKKAMDGGAFCRGYSLMS